MREDMMSQLRADFRAVFAEWILWGESTDKEQAEWGAWIKENAGDPAMMDCVSAHFAKIRARYA